MISMETKRESRCQKVLYKAARTQIPRIILEGKAGNKKAGLRGPAIIGLRNGKNKYLRSISSQCCNKFTFYLV